MATVADDLHYPISSGIASTAESVKANAAIYYRRMAEEAAKKESRWQDLPYALKAAIAEQGLCNVVGALTEVVRDLAYNANEGSAEEKDYDAAADMIEAAAGGCDLVYASSPTTTLVREAAIKFFKAQAGRF